MKVFRRCRSGKWGSLDENALSIRTGRGTVGSGIVKLGLAFVFRH